MNEDMSEILNKFSAMMNSSKNPETDSSNNSDNSTKSDNPSISPETISNMIKMLGVNSSTNNENTSNDENSSSMPNIDIETILKFKTVFDKMNSKDDPRAKLLRALKPYLKESRKEKVEQYIQFFNISKVIDLFGNASGGDVNK